MAKKPDTDAGTDQASIQAKADADFAAATGDETAKQLDSTQDQVAMVARASFHEHDMFQGRLLQHGDTFTAPRDRAVQLRANGLASYEDEGLESEAAKLDPEPSTDQGVAVITSKSMRSVRR